MHPHNLGVIAERGAPNSARARHSGMQQDICTSDLKAILTAHTKVVKAQTKANPNPGRKVRHTIPSLITELLRLLAGQETFFSKSAVPGKSTIL